MKTNRCLLYIDISISATAFALFVTIAHNIAKNKNLLSVKAMVAIFAVNALYMWCRVIVAMCEALCICSIGEETPHEKACSIFFIAIIPVTMSILCTMAAYSLSTGHNVLGNKVYWQRLYVWLYYYV